MKIATKKVIKEREIELVKVKVKTVAGTEVIICPFNNINCLHNQWNLDYKRVI